MSVYVPRSIAARREDRELAQRVLRSASGSASLTPSPATSRAGGSRLYCFSCRRGTSAYDLTGPLWGLETRGRDFIELRRRLTAVALDVRVRLSSKGERTTRRRDARVHAEAIEPAEPVSRSGLRTALAS